MIFLTTTAIEVDEELLNRAIVLTVDEAQAQTRAIHQRQREAQTLDGLLAREDREKVLRVHRNAQRLLRPLLVANPYARSLTFLDQKTRTRRDHVTYLTLIRAIALLHQYQRPVRTVKHDGRSIEYIEVTRADIATANRLAGEVLGRSLDELPPQTRRLLGRLVDLVGETCQAQDLDPQQVRFSRRDVREATGWGDTQLKVHLKRLEELQALCSSALVPSLSWDLTLVEELSRRHLAPDLCRRYFSLVESKAREEREARVLEKVLELKALLPTPDSSSEDSGL